MRGAGLRNSISSSVISEDHSLGLLTRAVSRFVTTEKNDCFTVWPHNTRRLAIGPFSSRPALPVEEWPKVGRFQPRPQIV
jgi:hypothetical protein